MSLFAELQRRNVFRVAALYVVGGWLILQIGDLLFDLMGLPDFALRIVLGILLLGLPVALVLAWVYELTPEGLKRDSEATRSTTSTAETGRKLNIAVIVAIVLALGALGLDRLLPEHAREAEKGSVSLSSRENDTASFSDPATNAAPDSGDGQVTGSDVPALSIAVLPFANMSADPDNEYFSDGIAEEILNVLATIPDLKVAARTSAFKFKGRNEDIADIARQLRVAHVLEGSVRRQGDRVRITAQLIRADNGYHLWSDTYDRTLDDIFAIQEEIATEIAAALPERIGLTPGVAASRSTSLAAYDLYLRARANYHARGNEGVATAIRQFEEVTRLDPEFAPGWSGLAVSWTLVPYWTKAAWSDNDFWLETSTRAEAAAERALALDPGNLEAGHALANVRRDQRNWLKALSAYESILAQTPDEPEVLEDYCQTLGNLGYWPAADAAIARAIENSPLSALYPAVRGVIARMAGDSETAETWLLAALALDPDFTLAHRDLFWLRVSQGRLPEARRHLEHYAVWINDEDMAYVIGLLEFIEGARDTPPAYLVTEEPQMALLVAAGLQERAWRTVLDRAQQVNYSLLWEFWEPGMERFRRGPEFQALLQRINVDGLFRTRGAPPDCALDSAGNWDCSESAP